MSCRVFRHSADYVELENSDGWLYSVVATSLRDGRTHYTCFAYDQVEDDVETWDVLV